MFKPPLNSSAGSLAARLSTHLLCACIIAYGLTAHALTDDWNVDVNKHSAVQRTYKHGESITATVTLRDGYAPLDLTGATAQFLWYTNSTDNLWWTNSATITSPSTGEVSFDWKPSMDTGAPINYYWLGIWPAGSTSPVWRVNGTIRLLDSPGFKPNTMAPPIQYIDFNLITITNQPWATTYDIATSHVDKLWQSPTRYTTADGRLWQIVTEKGYKAIAADDSNLLGVIWEPGDGDWPEDTNTYYRANRYIASRHDYLHYQDSGYWYLDGVEQYDTYSSISNYVWNADTIYLEDLPDTITLQRVDQVLTNEVTAFATTNQLATLTADVTNNTAYVSILQTSLVTRVWHTNHTAYIEDATLHSVSNFPVTYTVTTTPHAAWPLGLKYVYESSSTITGVTRYRATVAAAYVTLDYSSYYAKWSFNASFLNEAMAITAESYAPTLTFTPLTNELILTRSEYIVTDTAPLATQPYVDNKIILFENVLLYTSAGTNYFFRWSDTNQTYIVTGVPQ